MKAYKAWRYKCDFCGKTGGGKAAMATHERYCTMNPGRYCRMCNLGDLAPRPLAPAIAILRGAGLSLESRQAAFEELIDYTHGCPACTLAAIRQCNLHDEGPDGGEYRVSWPFNYEAEKARYLGAINADIDRREMEWNAQG